MRFAGDQFCGVVQQRVFPSLPFAQKCIERKGKNEEVEKIRRKRKKEKKKKRTKEGKKETSSLVAESPCYEEAIERRNVVVLCREALHRRKAAGCAAI